LDAAQFAAPPVQAVSKQLAQPAIISCDEFWTAALAGVASPSQTIRLLAESALMAGRAQAEGYQASAVVAMPRDWQPEAIGWPAFDQLSAASWVNTAPLPAALNAAVDSAPGLAAAGDSGIAAASLTALVELTDRMAAFASLTQDPDAYLARSLPPLLAPLSNAVAESNRAAQAAAALNQAATAAAPLAVKVGSDVNLISDDGRVPVVVENRSNEAVRGLVVRLTARTRAIQLGEPVSLDLEPDQAGTARVPVHAVANGVFRVQVDLLDSSGQPVAEGASLTMRVQAEWEDVGMAVVSGVLALALVFGVFTTVRKRRAEARSQADRARPAAPAGPAGPGSAA
jgi:hypothetical protein